MRLVSADERGQKSGPAPGFYFYLLGPGIQRVPRLLVEVICEIRWVVQDPARASRTLQRVRYPVTVVITMIRIIWPQILGGGWEG